jgi:hypothetical protein
MWSSNGMVASYSSPLDCRSGIVTSFIEVEGKPPFDLGDYAYSVDLSADGRWAALASHRRGVFVVNTADRRLTTLIPTREGFGMVSGRSESGTRVAISADGETIAAGSAKGGIVLIDRATKRRYPLEPVNAARTRGDDVTLVSMSSNGRFVVFQTKPPQAPPTTGSSRSSVGFFVVDRDTDKATRVAAEADRVEEADYFGDADDQKSMLVSDSGKWVVFLSHDGARSPLGNAPADAGSHVYAREVDSGHTWLLKSFKEDVEAWVNFGLTPDDLVYVLIPEAPPKRFQHPESVPAPHGELSWRALPDGVAASNDVLVDDMARFGLGPNRGCVLRNNWTMVCPVRQQSGSQ